MPVSMRPHFLCWWGRCRQVATSSVGLGPPLWCEGHLRMLRMDLVRRGYLVGDREPAVARAEREVV